jgi:tetratricopeptide (TPR) repeat protein
LLDFLERRVAGPDATLRDVREGLERADSLEAPDRAERLLERAVEIATEEQNVPEARWAMRQLAERRRAQGDTARALEWMQQAAATAEGDELFELNLEVANMATEECGEHLRVAAEAYEKLLEVEPSDKRVWQPLLATYRQLGEEDKLNDLAAQTLDALLEPGDRNLVRMERARFLIPDEDRTPDAVDALRQVLDEEPDHQEAGTLLAELYERAG